MSSLICPKCKTALKKIPLKQAAIWQCESCQAVTANLAVLRRYLRNDVIKTFRKSAISADKKSSKKCPSCEHFLREFTLQQDGQKINLDICRRCQLVWFDKGELDALPKTDIEKLQPKVKQNLDALMFRSEAYTKQVVKETAGKMFTVLLRGGLFLSPLPWFLYWIAFLFEEIVRFTANVKSRRCAAVVVVCAVAVLIIIAYIISRPREVVYPENPLSPEYRRNMYYLFDAAIQAPLDFSKTKGGLFCSHIPIVNEQDFPGFADKLKQELREAARSDFLFYRIVVGGMKVRDIDEPLLNAAEGLRLSRRNNIEIIRAC